MCGSLQLFFAKAVAALCAGFALACAATTTQPPIRAAQGSERGSTLPRIGLIDRAQPCAPARETALRLLTPLEYANTLRELFPGVELPASVELTNARTLDDALGISSLVLERHVASAIEVAARAAPKLRAQSCQGPHEATARPGGSDDQCLRTFLANFGLRAFRRPLSEAETARFVALFGQRQAASNFDGAFRDVVAAFLLAPQFLYRTDLVSSTAPMGEQSVSKNYAIAGRLSYFLWQSMPDKALFEAAARGELTQPGKVNEQVGRMLADPKAGGAFVSFVGKWFDLEKVLSESKSPQLFAHWLPTSAESAVEESKRFVRRVYDSKSPTLSSLLLSRQAQVDDAMATIYGVAPTGTLQEVELNPAQRGGLLTRTAFLAGRAHAVASPPLRGSFVLRSMLCQALPPPPPNVNNFVPSPKSVNGPSTNRQRFELAIRGGRMCIACHMDMDPLGYAFENYDATGRYLNEEQGLAIDAKVDLSKLGLEPAVNGAVALSQRLATSPEVAYCTAAMLYARAYQHTITRRDWCHIDPVYAAFARSGGDFKVALATVATSSEFLR